MKKIIRRVVGRFADQVAVRVAQKNDESSKLNALLQIVLFNQYRSMIASGQSLPGFSQVEFSSYSQNNEDGILLLIFSAIGEESRRVVEICAGDGVECNAANLIINRGWSGLLLDGDKSMIEAGESFYSRRTNAWRMRRLPPKLKQAWITAENVNELIESNGFTGEIDLLSIDVDGVDYWVWKKIEVIQPRVVLLEYNNRWPSEQSVTVPYSADFRCPNPDQDGEGYFGASLSAFVKLGREKGYRLIGANGPHTNAFFMRNGVGEAFFPEVSAADCLSSDYAKEQCRTKLAKLMSQKLIEV